MSRVSRDDIAAALAGVIDEESGKDVMSAGLVQGLVVREGHVGFSLEVDPAKGAQKEPLRAACEAAVRKVPGVLSVTAVLTAHRAAAQSPSPAKGHSHAHEGARAPQGAMKIPGVKAIVAVASGKGGVGKSTVAVNLAVSLAKDGAKVGIMDADVYGPNVPMMLGTGYDQPEVFDGKLVPIEAHGVKMISMAVLVPPDKPMILRGPMLHGVVRQFLSDVNWGELDYLIVDMPPGTGDVQLSLAQLVPVQGAVLVTTPQEVSLSDVRRAVKMFEQVNIPLLGVIENMSYFIAPDTGNRYAIFGTGGGQKLCDEYGLNFLGEVPMGMEVREGGDKGIPVVVSFPDSPQALAFDKVAEEVARQISIEAMKPELTILTRAG